MGTCCDEISLTSSTPAWTSIASVCIRDMITVGAVDRIMNEFGNEDEDDDENEPDDTMMASWKAAIDTRPQPQSTPANAKPNRCNQLVSSLKL